MYNIGESNIQGLGVIATEDITPETKIGIWVSKENNLGRYLNEDWCETKDLGRYCNHSINPNTYYKIIDRDVIIYSKGIKKGEDITVNYLDAQEITGYNVNINFNKTNLLL